MMKSKIFAVLIVLFFSALACRREASSLAGETTRILTHDEIERSYILYIPPSLNSTQPASVVLAFHGGGSNAENAIRMTDFNSRADEEGFIVVYPNGTGRLEDKILTWNGGTCCGYAQENNVDDVGFVRAIIADLQTIASLDTKRIYATGISNGAIMSYRLACKASDIFAAVAPVAGTLNYAQCQPEEPISIIHFHGTEDGHVPYTGGAGPDSIAGIPFASVKDSLDFWLNFNQCPSSPQTNSFDDIQHDMYTNCINGTEVQLYTVIGGKHAWPGSDGPGWPGGDQPTQSISATKLIWEFFAAHPKQ